MDSKQNMISFLTELKSKDITDETFDWLENYLNKGEQSIIHELILNIGDHFDDQQYVLNAFQGLIKIYDINPNILVKEVKETKMTAKILVHYICEIEYNKWNESGLQLLVISFDDNHYHHQIKQLNNKQQLQLVNNILNYFGQSDNAEIFSVLIQILFVFHDNQDIVLIIIQHQNARFFQEFLLEYLNHTKNDVSKPLFFIETIMKLDKDFFYVNDFKILQQISIRQIHDGTENERRLYLRNLKIIIQYGNHENILGDEILEAARMVQMTYTDNYCLKKCISIIDNLMNKQKQ
ncbi:unnamed protein product [Paramecium pentaurelia]|uniref:Uncharacterized protein n=1 Tax=Paramecium pentaurelia TaxID=43138 RepID=A0A8S1WLH1_9CILI|nr:unnamed protein product [Paramecium pentaurelia]